MWFITSIRVLDNEIILSSRCWGYFSSKEECIKILHNNITDIHECYYNYAVIEKINEGLYPLPIEREFFEYNRDSSGFFEIKEPEWDFTGNFAIG
jgi:hypothetical protein